MRVLCLIQSILQGIQCTLSGCCEWGESKQSDSDSKRSQFGLWSNLEKKLENAGMIYILGKHDNPFTQKKKKTNNWGQLRFQKNQIYAKKTVTPPLGTVISLRFGAGSGVLSNCGRSWHFFCTWWKRISCVLSPPERANTTRQGQPMSAATLFFSNLLNFAWLQLTCQAM